MIKRRFEGDRVLAARLRLGCGSVRGLCSSTVAKRNGGVVRGDVFDLLRVGCATQCGGGCVIGSHAKKYRFRML